MMRLPAIVLAILLICLPAFTAAPPTAAQQIVIDVFPASAIIRGENIWVRADPAADTDILTYLNRGDAITITDESIIADGEEYFPVEVDATGDSGWVRDLFIDPGSIVSVLTLEEPEDEEEIARDRPARRDQEADEPEDEEVAQDRSARRDRAAEEPGEEEIEAPRESRSGREERNAEDEDQGRARDREEDAESS